MPASRTSKQGRSSNKKLKFSPPFPLTHLLNSREVSRNGALFAQIWVRCEQKVRIRRNYGPSPQEEGFPRPSQPAKLRAGFHQNALNVAQIVILIYTSPKG